MTATVDVADEMATPVYYLNRFSAKHGGEGEIDTRTEGENKGCI